MRPCPQRGTTWSTSGCATASTSAHNSVHVGLDLHTHKRIGVHTATASCTPSICLCTLFRKHLYVRTTWSDYFFLRVERTCCQVFSTASTTAFFAACGHASMHVCTHVWCTLLSKRSNTLRTSDQDLSKASESYFQEGSARLVGAHSFAHAEPRWSSDPKAVHIGAQLGSTSAHDSGPHRNLIEVVTEARDALQCGGQTRGARLDRPERKLPNEPNPMWMLGSTSEQVSVHIRPELTKGQ